MKTKAVALLATVVLAASSAAIAETTVYARAKMPSLGGVAGMDNPPCTASEQSKTIGQQIIERGLDLAGKATGGLGLGSDPFNTRRVNHSVCMDLCVVVPPGASFKARASVAGAYAWQGDLPSGLPELINPGNWWAIEGPAVTATPKGDVVCYTAKNWSDNLERAVGLEVRY